MAKKRVRAQGITHRRISSVSELLGALCDIREPGRGPVWYRGHADASWTLLPHYDRLKKPLRETELAGKFRQNANLLLSQVPALPYDFGWMFLMQHYGVPTRLLDWSESPLVALYFAVADETHCDGALWALYPLELNRHSTSDEVYIPSFDDEWLANYSVTQYSKKKDNGILPIGAIATRNNPRIQAQLGVFTISHLKRVPIEEVEGGRHCVKLVIPRVAKQRIRNELQLLGITRFQIFPELASIGEALREQLQ
jgi:hypothetical protein